MLENSILVFFYNFNLLQVFPTKFKQKEYKNQGCAQKLCSGGRTWNQKSQYLYHRHVVICTR